MVGNIIHEWAKEGEKLEASEIVDSDLSLSEVRSKVENKSVRSKISFAYRLAVYSAGKKPDSPDKDVKLDTIITRLVKLNRTVRKQRNYTKVDG